MTKSEKELATDIVNALIEKGNIRYNGAGTPEEVNKMLAEEVAKVYKIVYDAVRNPEK